MVKCFIIDDEQSSVDVIKNYIMKIPALQLVGTSGSSLQGMQEIRKLQAELIFLDIQMDDMNGIELAKQLEGDAKVIFCTAYSRFAIASFDLDAIDYLVKPFSFQRFERAAVRALAACKHLDRYPVERSVDTDYLFIKTERKGKMVRLDIADIDFIEAKNNHVVFHAAEKRITSCHTLRGLEALLPKSSFIRVHKSYIVHIQKIAHVRLDELRLRVYKQSIPIGPGFKRVFMQHVGGKPIH